MNQDLPQVKTVKLLFVDLDEQQQAMFKMAFKMHNTTNYQVIDATTGQQPGLVIVDGDKSSGLSSWQKAKANYPNSVVVFFSKNPPSVTAPYLAKPIKFDTLFSSLRNLLQGNGVWVAVGNNSNHTIQTTDKQSFQNGSVSASQVARSSEMSIPRFDPNVGVLGAFRKAVEHQKDVAILVGDKPILAIFPATQRVWIAVDSSRLKELCRQDSVDIKIKPVPEDSNLQDRANATTTSTLWQLALWTADGRLVQPINPNTVFKLKGWPNLTRLAPLPESMRLSAFLTKTAVSLNMLYKLMPLDMSDILNYIAVTYLTEHLEVTQQVQETTSTIQNSRTHSAVDISVSSRPEIASTQAPKQQSGGLLSRFMKKLLNK